MADADTSIALLIDADNAPAAKIEAILAEVARHGAAHVRRAYGNWTKAGLKGWEKALHPYAIQPVQLYDYSKGKNASDIAMVIDAMDLLASGRMQAFALVSSDADFTPLVMRIRSAGLRVYGFGEAKTPEPFVAACSQFIYLEALGAAARDASATEQPAVQPVDGKKLRGDTRLVNMLRSAIESEADDDDEDGWVNLAAVGKQVRNQASFDPRNYGYAKLVSLIEAVGLFETKRQGQVVKVRDKRKG